MYKNSIKEYEPNHFGNEWGFYVDIENYQYNINTCTNKIIKRNQIQNNNKGDKYDYDYDYDYDYAFENIKDNKKNSGVFIKISSATIISAVVSYLIFYMS